MRRPPVPPTGTRPSDPEGFAGVAFDIADRLVDEALRDGDRCTWLGHDVDAEDGDWRSVYRTVDASLYGGLPGIALFLARAASRGGNAAHAETAACASRAALRQLQDGRGPAVHGWYDGLSGALWALGRTAELLPGAPVADDHALLQRILDAAPPEDGAFDLVGGVAGTLVGLLALMTRRRRGDILEVCGTLARWLLEHAQDGPGIGLSWRDGTPGAAFDYPPCGLAHGASSAGVALLEYWSVTRQDIWRDAAFEAFRYERQWFDRESGSWPDLRGVGEAGSGPDTGLPCPCYWCYGAAGIGLARFRAWELTGDRSALAEANAALFACSRRARDLLGGAAAGHDFDTNASLCHGAGSLIELMLYAASLGHAPQALPLARRLGMSLRPLPGAPWACGVVGGGECPGLMLGWAGIGELFLALDAPEGFRPAGLPPPPADA